MLGIFDSGVGGLTLVKQLLKKYPKIDFSYLGDTARVPYGSRSQEIVQKFAEEDALFLWGKGCKLVIVACNTVCSDALRYLQNKYTDKKILGVLVPGAEEAEEVTRFGRIGVIGTRGMVTAGAYERELKKLNKNIKVYSTAAPLLVPLVEEGWLKQQVTRKVMRTYLKPLKERKIDTLILACTHYPLLSRTFQELVGKVKIVDPAAAAAKRLEGYFERHPEIAEKMTYKGKQRYFVTDTTGFFQETAERFVGRKIELEEVTL